MPGRVPRILIVDDETDTCANLSDILTDLGYQVDTANDGPSALALVERNTYDVALLDLRMPGMDGLELYRRIKNISAGTVAIVVTAYASSSTAQSARDSGAWDVIPKPVNIDSLLGLVAKVIATGSVLVVDDDHDLCENLWDLLHARGYRIQLAHDVSEAEHALQQREFDVVLLDMKLPAGDGVQVLHALRQANQDAKTLLITGFASEMESRVQDALKAGAVGVCYKPFEVESLLSTVKKLSAHAPRLT